jgi:hypothetical protein
MKFRKKDLIVIIAAMAIAGFLAVTRVPDDPVITNDGCSYALTAKNLAEGNGYTYLGRPNVLFPPAYPLLIAAVYAFDKNIESAAMSAAMISWVLTVIPVYLITLLLFGENFIARILLMLALVLSPEFNLNAGKVFSETTFILLFYTAMFFFILFHLKTKKTKTIHNVIIGSVFALSFLARPEGFVVMVFAVLYLLMFKPEKIKTRLIHAGIIVLSFFIVASPYLFFLKKHTGSWQLSGRAGITLIGGEQLTHGRHILHYEKELYGLTPDGKGVYMYSGKVVSMARYLLKNFGSIMSRLLLNFRDYITTLWKMLFPLGILLILLFFLLPKLKSPAKKETGFILWMLAPSLTVLLFFVYDRYLLGYLPILYFIAVLGLLKAGEFIREKMKLKAAVVIFIQILLIIIFQFKVFDPYLAAAPERKGKTGNWNEVKELSLWMKDNIPDIRKQKVVARKALVGFYSGAEFAPVPWVETEGELLDYMDRIGAGYLEVDSRYFYEMRPSIYYLIETDRQFERLRVVRIVEKGKHKAVLYRLLPKKSAGTN